MVRISPKVKRIYLQRFLLSKFIFFKEKLELRDICCLFENQLWLEQKCLQDPGFSKIFGKSLEDLSVLLKEFNFKTKTTERTIRKFANRLEIHLSSFFLPKRNYKEAERICNGSFQLLDSKPSGIPRRQVTPTARIGKGYRDKGSAKDLAFDGSPSWQEVATHRGPIYHKGKRYEESQTTPSNPSHAEEVIKRISEIK
jgi:hypothetical protein